MPQLLDKTIEILDIKSIRGPNMWCWVEVLEAWIDIGDLEDYPSDKIPGFYDRLVAKLPSLIEHRCSYEERGGFLKRVEEGTWPVHIMEHLTLELQGLAGYAGGFGRARETNTRSIYKLIVASPHEQVTRQAITDARNLLLALIQDREFDLTPVIDHLREMIDDLCIGPSTGSIVNAAKAKLIPHIRLNSGNLVQLGYGAMQKRIWTAETDQTSAIAETISRDKDLTKSLLSAVGVPIPKGEKAENPEYAWEIAQDLGLPVVVKPQDGNHGRGVFTNLHTQEEVVSAFLVAKDEGSGVLVEKFIEGDEHRLLVVGNQLVAAAKGEECRVLGDGQHTILELIELQINSDPRRGNTEDFPLNTVRIDSIAMLELKAQGFTPDGIPAKYQSVLIQRNGNVDFDVTDLVHPSVAKKVVLAANTVGLDVAGVDLVSKDISRPLEEVSGAIVEVNAGPGLLMHLKPAKGKPRPVGEAIVQHLFPKENSSRIPIIGITGTNHSAVVAELCAHLLKLTNHYVGLSYSSGLFFNQRFIEANPELRWEMNRRILVNPMIEAGVIETPPKSIINEGLAYDLCSVGIVTDIDQSKLFPEDSITEERQIYSVYRTQVDVVLPYGVAVLNADDVMIAQMQEISPAEVMFYTRNKNQEHIKNHLEKGGRIVALNGKVIELYKEKQVVHQIEFDHIFYLQDGNVELIQAAMAAIGAGWALDLRFEIIEVGLETFVPGKVEL